MLKWIAIGVAGLFAIAALLPQESTVDIPQEQREYIEFSSIEKELVNNNTTEVSRDDFFNNKVKEKFLRYTGTVVDVQEEGMIVPLTVYLEPSLIFGGLKVPLENEYGISPWTIDCQILNNELKELAIQLRKGDEFTCDGRISGYIRLMSNTSLQVDM